MGKLKIGLDAQDIKDALRRRHPAFDPALAGVGRWTCIEEWQNIDLLALDAWSSAEVIGYEVKISRSDMRTELLRPSKRLAAVAMCTRFYFAVPAGLLTPEERAFEQPEDWTPEDFERQPCTNPGCTASHHRRGFTRHLPKPRGSKLKGTDREGVTIHIGRGYERGERSGGGMYGFSYEVTACCNVCKGRGTTELSRVEVEGPTLWVPPDVGLIAVGPNGCSVLKESPTRKITEPILPWPYVGGGDLKRARMRPEDASRVHRQSISQLVRWASFRPDPRHGNRIRI